MGQHANPQLERAFSKPLKFEKLFSTAEKIFLKNALTNFFTTYLSIFKLKVINLEIINQSNGLLVNISLAKVFLSYVKKSRKPKRTKKIIIKPVFQNTVKSQNYIKKAAVISKNGFKTKLTFVKRFLAGSTILVQTKKFLEGFIKQPVTVKVRYVNGERLNELVKRKQPVTFFKKGKNLSLSVEKITKIALLYKSPKLLNNLLKLQFVKTKNQRGVLFNLKDILFRQGLKKYQLSGLKIVVWGKLANMDRAKCFKIICGEVSTQKYVLKVVTDTTFVNTKTGTFGIKSFFTF